MMTKKNNLVNNITTFFLSLLSIAWVIPIALVLLNSFKKKTAITKRPFEMLNAGNFVGVDNYINGIEKTGIIKAFGYSLFITVFSVIVIILFTSMTAWMLARYESKISKFLYALFVFSMVVPFQIVMFTMTSFASSLRLNNPVGIIFIYLGFGAGLSIFIFSGFIKSIPLDIEEAAIIDGCTPIRTFFQVILPILQPTVITVAILNAMWVWNDYLLPSLLFGADYRTMPIAVQYLRGGFGSIDMGALMAMLVFAIVPIIIFYLACQKHIIAGVISGSVKG